MEMLRFAAPGADAGPALFDVTVERLDAFVESTPRPAVLVLRTRDLRRLVSSERWNGRSRTLRRQHDGQGLARYFGSSGPVALEGKYVELGRLRSALSSHLSQAPVESLHYLGVSDALFSKLMPGPRVFPVSQISSFRGSSSEAHELRRTIEEAASSPVISDVRVLILGPSGSGKELVARAIHDRGRGARGGLWVPVNCAAISAELLESELFGVEDRSVTGVAARVGHWEHASVGEGTLFLNEIGDLRLPHQAAILRALEEGEIRRIGGREPIRVSARIIADTNRDLYAMVQAGTFREDLYWRLAQLIIRVPGIVDRGDDLEEIAQSMWRDDVIRSPHAVLSSELIEALRIHGMPGGVREIRALLFSLRARFPGVVQPGIRELHTTWAVRGDGPAHTRDRIPSRSVTAGVVEPGSPASLREQVDLFAHRRPRYERLTDTLREILERVVERAIPLAKIYARTKSIASFAERVERDRSRFEDLRDLAGARIVIRLEDQIPLVCALLERTFEVEGKEAMAAEMSAGMPRRGYAALRLVVRLDRERATALSAMLGVEIPSEVLGLWAEIQVRTELEHTWAQLIRDLGHLDRLPLPARWHQELHAVARVFEAVDDAFARIHEGFSAYRTSFPAYLSAERRKREQEILARVLACAPDASVAGRLGTLAITDGDWDRAIDVLGPYAASGHQPALRDLGVAICQKHRDEPESEEHARGQRFLEQACADPHRDPVAWAALGGTWKRRGRYEEARDCYGRAHEVDPAAPYPLGGLLEAELVLRPEVDTVAALEPSIRRAVGRCREHIEVGVNLPWAHYDLGKFLVLLGERHAGLAAVAQGVELSGSDHQLRTTIEAFERLETLADVCPGIREARAILVLGRAIKFPSADARHQLDAFLQPMATLVAPVLFVAGDAGVGAAEAAGRQSIEESLRGFSGTIVEADWLRGIADAVRSGIRLPDLTVMAVGSDGGREVVRRVAAALGVRTFDGLAADARASRAVVGAAS